MDYGPAKRANSVEYIFEELMGEKKILTEIICVQADHSIDCVQSREERQKTHFIIAYMKVYPSIEAVDAASFSRRPTVYGSTSPSRSP